MNKVEVNTVKRKYTIAIQKKLTNQIGVELEKLKCGDYCFIITNKKIYSLYRANLNKSLSTIDHQFCFVPDGEEAKSKKWLFRIIDKIIKQDSVERNIFIVCLGGGVIGDLGAFAASIYKRGVPVVQIPTTFLAQIDSSIGGKTAINFEHIKNIVGAFYQPTSVLIDPLFLETLPLSQMKQGIAEAIKYGIIADPSIFNDLEQHKDKLISKDIDFLESIINRCVQIKANVVEQDENEARGIRTILNFGHTVGHALESVARYRISHGEAVAWGMIAAADISHRLGYCDKDTAMRIERVVRQYRFPPKLNIPREKLINFLMRDKKFINKKVRMVLVEKLGVVKVVEGIDLEIINKSLQHIGIQ
jgi:3-dehydroquinate synthase